MTQVATGQIKAQLLREDERAPKGLVGSLPQLSPDLQRDIKQSLPCHVVDTGLSGIRYYLHSQGGGVRGVCHTGTVKPS